MLPEIQSFKNLRSLEANVFRSSVPFELQKVVALIGDNENIYHLSTSFVNQMSGSCNNNHSNLAFKFTLFDHDPFIIKLQNLINELFYQIIARNLS